MRAGQSVARRVVASVMTNKGLQGPFGQAPPLSGATGA